MLAVTGFDNLLVLFFFAAAILFQILTKAASKGRRRPPETRPRATSSQTGRPSSTERDEGDQEQIRRFLEALGQPTTSPLPPLKTRPPDLPEPAELPREIRLPGQIPPTRSAKQFRPTTAETSFEVHQGSAPLESAAAIKTPAEAYALATRQVPKMVEGKIDIATLLRSPSGLRNAIILREIFGPPRSMQPLDLVGSV